MNPEKTFCLRKIRFFFKRVIQNYIILLTAESVLAKKDPKLLNGSIWKNPISVFK